MKTGIDVSYWQGDINWKIVASENKIDFAIIRAGYGKNRDSRAETNARGCADNGIPFGLYWFSYAKNTDEAREEARKVVDFASKHRVEYPIYFDFEYDSERNAIASGVNVTPEFVCSVTEAFCSEVEKCGYYTGIYTNIDYLDRFYTDEELLHKYDIWLAQWSSEPSMYVNLWQCTSSWSVNGISGTVDKNIDYVDLKSVIKNAGLNHLSKCPTCGRYL